MTLLTHLSQVLAKASDVNQDSGVPPVCVLWPDGDRHWEAGLKQLRGLIPQLYTLGDYNPQEQIGPAAWLRFVLAIHLTARKEVVTKAEKANSITDGEIPIFYLPGVSRQALRAVDSCDPLHKPLVELQFRGIFWSQESARDWTPLALLLNRDQGLGLDVKRDAETKELLKSSLPQLLEADTKELNRRTIDASYLRRMLIGGHFYKQVLQYLDDEVQAREHYESQAAWEAFLRETKAQLDFDLVAHTRMGALEAFGERRGKWKEVFNFYQDVWRMYPNIPDALRQQQPKTDLLWLEESGNHDGWPQWNDENEQALLRELKSLIKANAAEIRDQILSLEQRHAHRRTTVWAEQGKAPLAAALKHLAQLARHTSNELPGANCNVLAKAYAEQGYLADDSMLHLAASMAKHAAREKVLAVGQRLYLPWLEAAAKSLQQLVQSDTYPAPSVEPHQDPPAGTCIFFIDGLRYDMGMRLHSMLEAENVELSEMAATWSALPSVTATAKPAVSPVAHLVSGGHASESFEPNEPVSTKPLTTQRFRKMLEAIGVQVLKNNDTGDVAGKAWTETKVIDKAGHDGKASFAGDLDKLLDDIVTRIKALLASGWAIVHVVTDHGWLYLPGGLPTEALDSTLTMSKWGRCAAIKEGASLSGALQIPWTWNPSECFVIPHGVCCYKAGQVYAHGGLSPQECITPQFSISPVGGKPSEINSLSLKPMWTRSRCRILADGKGAEGLLVDLRQLPGQAKSSVVPKPKPFNTDGMVSLAVTKVELDEVDHLFVVVLDKSGRVVKQQRTSPS